MEERAVVSVVQQIRATRNYFSKKNKDENKKEKPTLMSSKCVDT